MSGIGALPEKRRLLAETPPFDGLPDRLLRRAAERAEWIRIERRGTRPLHHVSLLRLVRGQLHVLRKGARRNLLLALHAPGDLVGLHALWGRNREEAWVEARAELLALHLPRPEVIRLGEEHPPFALEIARLLAERLEEAHQRLHWSHERSVTARIARLLVLLARRHGVPSGEGVLEVAWRITHQEIAAWAGATRETTTVVLGRLRRDGLIAWRGQRLRVLDAEALEQLQ